MSNRTTSAPALGAAVSSEQIAEHEGLVHWVVRRQRLEGLPFDDALHEGRIGLWSALRHYDPSRGTAFSSYAVPAIARAVWRAVAAYRQPLRPPSVPPVAEEALDWAILVHTAQVEAVLLDLVDALPTRLRAVIVDHYGTGDRPPQTFAAIGQALGISKQRVQQLHVMALLWLAHPAHSLPLRRLLERHGRLDYREARARRRRVQRARRHKGARP
jgi:RNA polymerase sigma factor (sigma-70 family)